METTENEHREFELNALRYDNQCTSMSSGVMCSYFRLE